MKRNPLVLTYALVACCLLLSGAAHAETTKASLLAEPNPAADGFLAEESDAKAIELADQVMLRLGGRSAWDATRFVTWKFFGNRFHVWDKHTGDIRVEGTERESKKDYVILMNLTTKGGRAWLADEEITDPEALAGMLERGESAWINDSYWMFMPYKLKDTGVALEYLGEQPLLDGRGARTLQLSFRDVGRTPENKYLVYVANDSGLVEQWDFFTNASDPEPRFQIPWRNWRRHGAILLSNDRGRGQHTEIAVFDELPAEVFSSPDPVDLTEQPPSPTGNLAEAPIFAVEGDVNKPVLEEAVNPEYPETARKARTTGRVVVRTVIDKEGMIRDAWITESVEENLDRAALDAVRQWTFEAATLNGEPVDVYYNLTVNFELDGDDSKGESKEGSP